MQMAAAWGGSISVFKHRLQQRLETLAVEFGHRNFVLPVGLFLVLDKENGGDPIAEELVRRFHLLNLESRNVIDFYYLGWEEAGDGSIVFNLARFEHVRAALKEVGVKQFGGNADLILVDAWYTTEGVRLDFSKAIRVDLSTSSSERHFPTLGQFLQALIATAEEIRETTQGRGVVCEISDKLGLAIATKSLMSYVLEKLGGIIGAAKLATLAVQKLGPSVALEDL